MRASGIIIIIFGVLLVIGGFYCLLTPGITFATLAPLCGIAMIVDGIGDIVSWNDRRKAGVSDTWSLVGAIVSLLLGIFLLCNIFAQFLAATIIVYVIAIWVILAGLLRIAGSLQARKARNNVKDVKKRRGMASEVVIGKNWGLVLALGILMVLVGIFGLINPSTIALAMGYMIGFCIISAGISLITVGFSQ